MTVSFYNRKMLQAQNETDSRAATYVIIKDSNQLLHQMIPMVGDAVCEFNSKGPLPAITSFHVMATNQIDLAEGFIETLSLHVGPVLFTGRASN